MSATVTRLREDEPAETREQVLRRLGTSRTMRELAKILGCAEVTVWKLCKQYGIERTGAGKKQMDAAYIETPDAAPIRELAERYADV